MFRQPILAALVATLTALLLPSSTLAQFEDEPVASPALSEAARRSPAVASLLDTPRDTPAEKLRAVFLLLDLGESDIARSLWREFTPDELDEEAEAALVRELGVARFLSLVRQAETNRLDGARAFAESALQNAAKLGRNPQQLAKLIAALGDAEQAIRRAARYDLSVTGDAGAVACLEALAAADNESLRAELMLTLAAMRPAVEPMLVAALADGEDQFCRDVVELVGYLQLQDAVPWLAALAAGADENAEVVAASQAALTKMGLSLPNSAEARAVILSNIRRLETHQHPPELTTWWSFDAEKMQSREVSPAEHKQLSIARLARLTSDVPGASLADRRLGLIYAQQIAKLLGQPLESDAQQVADSLDDAQLSEALHEAMERKQFSAAIACATLLGTRGRDSALGSVAGSPGPLTRALTHPDRELRFAALEAIMKIKPQRSFAGASGVAKALWYFASGSGDPQVVVASSVVGKASDWAGQLRGLGYDPTPVTTGRQTLLTALNSPRLELMLVDSDIGRPLLREVVFGLRSNPQLSHVPIAVVSSLHNLSRAERMAEEDPWLIATPRPHSVESLQTVIEELNDLRDSHPSTDTRTRQAVAALTWIAELLEDGHPYDELLREADQVSQTIYDPELMQVSLRVLASLGTASSQQLLVDVASTPTLDIETRRAAGEAFAKSVGRYGKLLTSEEILRQYDRYNASETADQATQAVLGDLLDLLEKQK
ncbi:MAG: hypothetical protein AAGD11_05200 [Planctomycetota bacterium]